MRIRFEHNPVELCFFILPLETENNFDLPVTESERTLIHSVIKKSEK